jgi:Tfp pilus assembly protein PilN
MSTRPELPATLTLAPPEAVSAAEWALRVPRIAADLLPLEIVESRRDRRVRGVVVVALVSFVAVLVAWYALSAYETAQARGTLTAAEQSGDAVLRQQRHYSEVVNVQAASKVITTQLATLLANDLQWSRMLAAVARSAPPGVALTGLIGALETGAEAAAADRTALPNTSGEKQIGSLTVNGSAPDVATVAAYVDALDKITGLGNPMLDGLTTQSGKLRFTVRLDITSGGLGGRYQASGSSGGN